MAYSQILGTGLYVPGESISNTELMELANIEFDHNRHQEKLGIACRHIAKLRNLSETTLDFAEKAARNALNDAGLTPEDIQLIVVATDTPEYISPATSILVHGRLVGHQSTCGAFDINATCAGFTTAFDTVSRIVASDPGVHRALVIGVYNMPAFVRDGDVFGYSIFADGAGAFVIGRGDDSEGSRYVQGYSIADGTQWDYVGIYAGGSKKPITHEILDQGTYGLELLQRLPGDRNVKLWPRVVEGLCHRAGWKVPDIDHIIFTQINKAVIHEVMEILQLPLEKTTTIMEEFGYTGSGCVPMAFHRAKEQGLIQRGDKICFVASGAGLAVASNAFIY
jgi:3-oxoacyl-[acyl-carrier-protein] synthase-3